MLVRGLSTQPDQGGTVPFYEYAALAATKSDDQIQVTEPGWNVLEQQESRAG